MSDSLNNTPGDRSNIFCRVFICIRTKKKRTEDKTFHVETMISRKPDRVLECETQHVSFRQNVEEREQEKGLKVVRDVSNE